MAEKRLVSFRTLQNICNASVLNQAQYPTIRCCTKLWQWGTEKKGRCNADNCPIWRRAKKREE